MDIKQLKRDPELAKKEFVTVDEKILMCKDECKIMIPKRFVESKMATVGSNNSTIGICAWIIHNKYFVTRVNAFIPLNPINVTEADVEGDTYILFHFEKNSTVVPNLMLAKDGDNQILIFNEIIAKARSPWYLTYQDRCQLFKSSAKFTGSNITNQLEVTELIVAHNTRLKKDRSKYIRHCLKTQDDMMNMESVATGLKTVEYSTSSPLTSFAGSYMGRGINRALNNPSERVETIEEYLRM